MNIYNKPLYYEIAFSFVDTRKQVDLFFEFINRFSRTNVKKFLDIGCGPGCQLMEIAGRGYGATGLDKSVRMLKYLEKKAEKAGLEIETVKADMTNFRLKEKADFAFILMGTIQCINNNEDFLSHLHSVASSLKKGGLYLIENFPLDWPGIDRYKPQIWTMEKDGVKVKTTYKVEWKDTLKQLIIETLRLEVNDHGKKFVFDQKAERKFMFPKELLALVQMSGEFEFIGWFEHDKLKPLKKSCMNNYVLLRRQGGRQL